SGRNQSTCQLIDLQVEPANQQTEKRGDEPIPIPVPAPPPFFLLSPSSVPNKIMT
ncbi:hypothetical protein BaRGS_00014534, partial [Batillaria attramentaria]